MTVSCYQKHKELVAYDLQITFQLQSKWLLLLMLQKSGIHQLRLVVDIPFFTSGFYTSKRWLALGFLNHQQYDCLASFQIHWTWFERRGHKPTTKHLSIFPTTKPFEVLSIFASHPRASKWNPKSRTHWGTGQDVMKQQKYRCDLQTVKQQQNQAGVFLSIFVFFVWWLH